VEEIRFTKELQDVKLDKMNVEVCLECKLSKDGQKVEWFKDSKKIRPDMEHDIQDEGKLHRLIIRKAAQKDIGTYRADYMHLSTSAKLSIEGKTTVHDFIRSFGYEDCILCCKARLQIACFAGFGDVGPTEI